MLSFDYSDYENKLVAEKIMDYLLDNEAKSILSKEQLREINDKLTILIKIIYDKRVDRVDKIINLLQNHSGNDKL